MSEETLAGLFVPFRQADASTTRRYGGTGLGLAISKRLAEFLGGNITAQSRLSRGSTLTLTVATGGLDGVPIVADPNQYRLQRNRNAAPSEKTPSPLACRVLLAEDSPDSQRFLTIVLRRAGADVAVAENGIETLRLALSSMGEPTAGQRDNATKPFDVILMDMQMPLMDGYEATRRLRQAGYSRPIVALTAHAMADDRQKCIDAGCDDYTTKPVERDKIIATIAKYTARPTDEPVVAPVQPVAIDATPPI
jgi:CheY-like chemotaxis protein